ncbi:MAG: hypothetical protein DRQ98_03075 [Gammaproteobacteria bacterium]|nr:MAG: hypothetical protein DRQ98_03075 [Gammaproteobacteria bacterium]
MFYGWILLAYVSACYFAIVGGGFYGFTVVMPNMIETQGWSRTVGSVGVSIMMMTFGLNAPLIAILIARIKTHGTMLLGGLIVTLGCIVLYYSNSVLAFYMGSLLLGVGFSTTSIVPGSHLITQWFNRRRSMALGIFMVSGGLGAFVFAPVFAQVIESTGDWRNVWFYVAVIGISVGVTGFFIIRERPSDVGQHIDGIDPNDDVGNGGKPLRPARVHKSVENWSQREAFHTRVFWLILFASCIVMTGNAIVTSQLVLHLTDLGISQVVAASALGVVGALNTVGRFSGGILGDLIEPKLLMLLGMILEFLGIYALISADQEFLVYLFAVLFGLGFGLYLVAFTSVVVNYFGAKNYARIFALMGLCYTLFIASGPILAGYAYDRLGSYDLPFYVILGLGAFATLALLMMKPPVKPPAST